MSGAAGGVTINKEDLKATIRDYRENVLKPLNLDKSYNITGIRRRPEKMVFGDIDIVLSFPQGEKKQLKKDFANHLAQVEKIPTMPHKKNLKYFIHGSIVTTLYPIVGKEDQYIQIDNIIAASEDEGKFTYSMLDLPAQEQGLALGLAKAVFTELNPAQVNQLFKDLNIPQPIETPTEGEEYDFNLNTSELSLRIVPIGKNGGREIWKSSKFSDIQTLLNSLGVDIEKDKFDTIIQTVKGFKNRRSIDRLKGMFARNIRVGSAEVGRDKGMAKQQSLDKVAMLEEKYGLLATELIKPFLMENIDKPSVAVFPGKFKPPHKDHLSRILAASQYVGPEGKVQVLIGPNPTKQSPDQETITSLQSLAVFKLYKAKGILPDNVEVSISQYPSPVLAAYKEFEKNLDKNEDSQTPYIAVFGKEEANRFSGVLKIPNVTINSFPEAQIGNESATNLRVALKNEEDISKFLPKGITSEEYKQILDRVLNLNESKNNRISSKTLISNLLEQENTIKAFFGGNFKPPTKTHFNVIKKTLENYPEIDKMYIVIGGGLKDNISLDESLSIWEIYKKYLPIDKIEIIKAESSPIKYVKNYIKNNTDHKSYIIIGSKDDGDQEINSFINEKELFDNYGDSVEVKNVVTPDGVSQSKAKELASTSKEQFFQTLPEELTNEEKQTIFNYLQSAIQEGEIKKNKLNDILTTKIKGKLKFILKALKQENKETKEAFSKLLKSSRGEITLSDEDKKEIGNQMKDVLKLAGLGAISIIPGGIIAVILIKLFKAEDLITPSSFKVNETGLEIATKNMDDYKKSNNPTGKNPRDPYGIDQYSRELMTEEESYDTFDYNTQIKSLTEFMLDLGLNINPIPDVKFINDDVDNANNFFGKTAYYDPQYNRIVLYTLNRHPKDVMRSFAHEMIHHLQNCEDRLGEITTQNTNEDDHLEQLEREAYEKGNICFRNWADSILNEAIVGNKIECDNCGWSWNIVDGGDDLYICHKCGNDNTPQLNKDENIGNPNSLNENQDLSPFDYDQDGNESRIGRDINNKKGWRRLGSKSSQNSAIKKYLDKYTSGYKWSNPPKSEKFSDENGKMYKTPYIMYIHLLQTSEGENNIVDALNGMVANEPDPTMKQVLQALILVFTNKNDQFKKIYTQFESIIEKNAKDDSGANPFAALKYAYENFNDKKGIFSKFVRNGWSAGSYNLNEANKPYKHKHGFDDKLGKDPFGLNQFAREIAEGVINEDIPNIRLIQGGANPNPPTTLYHGSGYNFDLSSLSFSRTGELKGLGGFGSSSERCAGLYTFAHRNKFNPVRAEGIIFVQNYPNSSPRSYAKGTYLRKKTERAYVYKIELDKNIMLLNQGAPGCFDAGELDEYVYDTKIKYKEFDGIGSGEGEIILWDKKHIKSMTPILVGVPNPLKFNGRQGAAWNELDRKFKLTGKWKELFWFDSEEKANNFESNKDRWIQYIMDKYAPIGEPKVTQNPLTENILNEGRYDTLANKLSSIAFKVFKDTHDRGDKVGTFEFRVDHPDDEHDIPSKDFYFDFEGKVEITDDEYGVDGGANVGFGDEGEEITPLLSVKFKIPKNPKWSTISMDLKDVVRHELEHLTQDGYNERSGKYMKDDQLVRDLIDADVLSKSQYFKLEKEVDAMLQGLYFKAKKAKRPFKDVINDYLNIFIDQETITQAEKEEILDIWRSRAISLSLPKID